MKKILLFTIAVFFYGLIIQKTTHFAFADNYFISLNAPNYTLGQQVTVSWTTTVYNPYVSFNPSCQLTITNQNTGGEFTTYSSDLNGSYTFTPTGPNRYLANIYCQGNPEDVAYCSGGGYIWLPHGGYGCSPFPPSWPPSWAYNDGSAWSMGDNIGPPPTPTPSPTPYIILTATPSTISFDSTSKLTWYGGYITSCTGPSTLNPSGLTSGTASTPQLTATTTYTITCNSPYGTVSAQAKVTVGAAPTSTLTPTPTRTQNPTSTPTQTVTPTITPTKTITSTPTLTLTPTPDSTVVCGGTGCAGGGTASGTSSGGGGGGFGGANGGVFIDTNDSKCVSGATPYSDPTPLTLHLSDSDNIYNKSVQSTGSFSFPNVPISSSDIYVLTISSLPSQYLFVNATGSDGSVTFQSGSAHFVVQGPVGISVCLSKSTAWFQTNTGDVRMGTVTDSVPTGLFASTDSINSSIFFSNNGTGIFGAGSSSTKKWDVNNEFSAAGGSSTLGSSSYDFYVSRVKSSNALVTDLSDTTKVSGCSNSNVCAPTNLPTGIYEYGGINGGQHDIILTNITIQPGAHVTLLVNGTLTIQFPTDTSMNSYLSLGSNGLLIVAAKGDISVASSTGMSDISSTTPNLVGIYSAEGNIILQSKAACPTTADNRLNVAGALIANALNPFVGNGKGSLINHRSLCIGNQTKPALYVSQRLDFILQLTDFYKTSDHLLREVNP